MDAVGAVLVALAVVAAILIFMWLTVHIVQQVRGGRSSRLPSPLPATRLRHGRIAGRHHRALLNARGHASSDCAQGEAIVVERLGRFDRCVAARRSRILPRASGLPTPRPCARGDSPASTPRTRFVLRPLVRPAQGHESRVELRVAVHRVGAHARVEPDLHLQCVPPAPSVPPLLRSARANVRVSLWARVRVRGCADRGAIVDTVETISCVDLRESIFNFKRQEVYTKDTVQVEVNAVMYHRIMDVKRAIYEVDDIVNAVQGVAQTQLKEVFGSMSLAEALSSQKAINEHMQRNFAPVFAAWGLEVLRIELLDLKPVDGSDTATSMKQQMKAERMRRAQFIEAEGKKAAMRLESEGVKRVLVNKGVAEQEATRRMYVTASIDRHRTRVLSLSLCILSCPIPSQILSFPQTFPLSHRASSCLVVSRRGAARTAMPRR